MYIFRFIGGHMTKNLAFRLLVIFAVAVLLAPAARLAQSEPRQARQNSHSAKHHKPKAEKIVSLPEGLPLGQPYFQPSTLLPGIGLGRQSMTDEERDARATQLIKGQQFAILRDPQAIAGAQRIIGPELDAIFSKATEGVEFPAKILKGLTYIESWGNPLAASCCAKGIMQIVPGTAKMMGLKVGTVTEYKLVPQKPKLIKKAKGGQPAVYKDMPDKRVAYKTVIDERLMPEKAVPAAAKFLAMLTKKYEGRTDFAVWAYHSGEGFPDKALTLAKKYGISNPTVAKLFFSSSPVWNEELYALYQKDMSLDYGPMYYFTVMQAVELLELYRTDPSGFRELAQDYQNPFSDKQRTPTPLSLWYSPKQTAANNEAPTFLENTLLSAPGDPAYLSYALRATTPQSSLKNSHSMPEVVGALEYVAFETRRLWETKHPKNERFVPIDVTNLVDTVSAQQASALSAGVFAVHNVGAVDLSYSRLPKLEATCLKFVLDDLNFGLFLASFAEGKGTMHLGVSPEYKKFFAQVYEEMKQKQQARL